LWCCGTAFVVVVFAGLADARIVSALAARVTADIGSPRARACGCDAGDDDDDGDDGDDARPIGSGRARSAWVSSLVTIGRSPDRPRWRFAAPGAWRDRTPRRTVCR
jgi:hypothetical protein